MANIRVMTIEDYENVYALWINTPGMGLNNVDDTREGIAAYLRRNPSTCFVAEEEGRLVGAVLAGHDGRRGYIYHMAVSAGHQRKGIARTLVGRVMEALDKEGIQKAALVVFSRNETGGAFWEEMGFARREDLEYRNKNIHGFTRIDT